jgi:hypothetical protein
MTRPTLLRAALALPVLALAVAGGVPASGGGDARASCGGTDFPFEFTFEGYVDFEDAHGFTVDRLRVVYPKGNTLLPWNPARYDVAIDRSAVDAGAFVEVVASLRPDGTLLAQYVKEASASFPDGGGIHLVSGRLDSLDGDGIVVDGEAYAFFEEPDRVVPFYLTEGEHELSHGEMREGDALAFRLVEDEDSGTLGVAEVLVRPSGDGAVLAGRVTSNTGEEGGSFFGHDGLYFEVEGVRAFFPYNEDMAVRAVARERYDDSDLLETLVEGDGVRMTGWYRDGVFFLEDLFVTGSESGARPPRAVVAEGIVTRAAEDDLEVNGVAFRRPTRRGARRAAEAARVGDRVRVQARPPAEGGDVVARSVRTFRRR